MNFFIKFVEAKKGTVHKVIMQRRGEFKQKPTYIVLLRNYFAKIRSSGEEGGQIFNLFKRTQIMDGPKTY